MNITEQQRHEYLKDLYQSSGLYPKIWGGATPDELKNYLSDPHYFYTQGWPDNPGYFPVLKEKRLLPLWECVDCIYAVDLSNERQEYIHFFIEYPNEYEVDGNTIFHAFLSVIDGEVDGGATEDEIRQLIGMLQMPHQEKLLTLIKTGKDFESYRASL